MELSPFVLYRMLPYLAVIIFLVGLIYRLALWLSSPVPFRTPLTPAQGGPLGSVRLLWVWPLRWSPQASPDPWLWLGVFIFHLCLVLIAIRHLRYFLYPVPGWILVMQTPGLWAGYSLFACLAFFLMRRLVIPKVNYVSRAGDYLLLGLVMALAGSGLCLRWGFHPDLAAVKDQALALLRLDFSHTIEPLGFFEFHFGLALLLLAIFPYTKLIHGLGFFLNPILGKADNTRRKRHINPWMDELERMSEMPPGKTP